MAEFPIQDTALTGFAVVRDHPRAIWIWALFALLESLVFGVTTVASIGPDYARLLTLNASAGSAVDRTAAAQEMMSTLARLAPAFILLMIVWLLIHSVITSAMIRAVLRPTDNRFGFLRAGAAELRQFGLALLTWLVFAGVYIGLFIVVGLLSGIVAVAAKGAAILVLVLGVLGVIGTLIFLAIRLSLAPPLTFDRGRIDLWGSFALTRGRFWALFGTYLMAGFLIVVVYLLCILVIGALGAVMRGGDLLTGYMKPDMSSLATYYTPVRLLETAVSSLVLALVWPIGMTPASAAYRRLAGLGPGAAEAFS